MSLGGLGNFASTLTGGDLLKLGVVVFLLFVLIKGMNTPAGGAGGKGGNSSSSNNNSNNNNTTNNQ